MARESVQLAHCAALQPLVTLVRPKLPNENCTDATTCECADGTWTPINLARQPHVFGVVTVRKLTDQLKANGRQPTLGS